MPNNDLISREAALAWFFRPYSNEEYYSNLDVERALKGIPAVDAITVEWLKQQFYDNPNSQWAEKCRDVFTGWQKWQRLQKEQEAQNG